MLKQAFVQNRFLMLGASNIYNQTVKKHTLDEIKKDVFGRGDITTNLLLKHKDTMVKAQITAKSNGILAGIDELKWLLKKFNIRGNNFPKDGAKISVDEIIVNLQGRVKNILLVERTALNLIQRMSGIATLTHQMMQLLPKNVFLAATRKTFWGLLDKKAVVAGGGASHRLGLWNAILIKDNHLKIADAEVLLSKAWYAEKKGAFIEIEANSMSRAVEYAQIIKELYQKKPLKIPVIIMLDNFAIEKIESTVQKIRQIEPQVYIEISGGITAKNISEYAKIKNIDILSCGFLTHSAQALDFSLNISP